MGIIYKISFPGKTERVYVGQTSRTLEKRIKEHEYKASYLDEDEGCWMLNRHIRKYGTESMKIEILIICEDENLNSQEELFIDELNSIYPDGFNLTKGGNVPVLLQVSREKISKKLRKYNIEMNLPIHVHRCKDYTGDGFVVSIPGYKKKQFCNDDLGNINEKKEQALAHYKNIMDGNVPKIVKKQLPMYVMDTVQENKTCFEVNNPKYKTCRFFYNNLSREEVLISALQYHQTTVDGTAPIREKLRNDPNFLNGDMKHIQKKKNGAIVMNPSGLTMKSRSFASSAKTVQENIEDAIKYRDKVYNR